MALIEYKLNLFSDYMINTGLSTPGAADNQVVSRKDGSYYIPYRTIRGLVRDACRELCQRSGKDELWVCDGEYEPGKKEKLCGVTVRIDETACICCRLFGSPGKINGKLFFSDAVLPDDIEKILKKYPEDSAMRAALLNEQKLNKPHLQIDPKTRRGIDDAHFIFESISPLGGIFTGAIELQPGVAQLSDKELKLLQASLRAVKELGHKRRRGYGECSFEIPGIEADLWTQVHEADDTQKKATDELSINLPEKNAPVVLQVKIIADKHPLFLSHGQAAGNYLETQGYITGSRLRGALASIFYGKNISTDAANQLFFSDTTKFTNCYPAQDNNPAMPMPLSALNCKIHPGFPGEGHIVEDVLLNNASKCCKTCEAPLQRMGKYRSVEVNPKAVTSTTELTTRTALEKGSAKEGSLFSRKELEFASSFIGNIFTTQAVWEFMKQNLGINGGEIVETSIALGTQSLATMEISPVEKPADDWWLPDNFETRVKDKDDKTCFTLTLLSDAFLLDEFGQSSPKLDASVLARELGVRDILFCIVKANQSVGVISGWNKQHNLPRPKELTIAKGSCYHIKMCEGKKFSEIKGALKELEKRGLGLRCNEGFGRVIINDPFHIKYKTGGGK